MGTLEEVKQMQQQGRSDQEISQSLQQRGISQQEISSALSQAKISGAVVGQENTQFQSTESPLPPEQLPSPASFSQPSLPSAPSATESLPSGENMQPSMLSTQPQPQESPYPEVQGNYTQQSFEDPYAADLQGADQGYYQDQYQGYDQGYQNYQGSLSSDTITEISEQVVDEKLSDLRDHLKKILDIKTVTESKLSTLDERLRRIEKIIDQLHISVIRKIGDYVTGIEDVKKELHETQKTFTSQKPHKKKK